ncbi:MAG TPA: aminodeoxychorismate lyase, partial [Accumulibacter sp.]|nr:aminodeoxychorismate lyase [Accumulibacter sp.]
MRKLIVKLFVLAVVVLALLAGAIAWVVQAPIGMRHEQVDFTISPGSSMRSAAREIAAAGAELQPWLLILLGKWMRVDTSIKAGSYEITR